MNSLSFKIGAFSTLPKVQYVNSRALMWFYSRQRSCRFNLKFSFFSKLENHHSAFLDYSYDDIRFTSFKHTFLIGQFLIGQFLIGHRCYIELPTDFQLNRTAKVMYFWSVSILMLLCADDVILLLNEWRQ